MKKVVVCSILAAVSSANMVLAQSLPVSIANSEVRWQGSKGIKVLGTHTGTIAIKEADVDIDKNGEIKKAEILIDMTQITNEDLSGTLRDQLIGHLKSKDFFNVEDYQVASFKSNSVKKLANNRYEFKGNLSIKGKSQPASFIGTYSKQGEKHKLIGSLNFDRTKYGIKYGSGQFFTDLGDKLINDQVEVSFNLITE